MWVIEQATQILSTVYTRIRFRYNILKSSDDAVVQVRNYSDSAYASVDVLSLMLSGQSITPGGCVILYSHDATVVAGAALSVSANTSQFLNALGGQGTGANSDQRKLQIPLLPPGTYQFKLLYASTNASGSVDFTLKDEAGNVITTIGTVDQYTASTTFNKLATLTFTLPAYTATELWFHLTVNGKNASSGGYASLHTSYQIMEIAN